MLPKNINDWLKTASMVSVIAASAIGIVAAFSVASYRLSVLETQQVEGQAREDILEEKITAVREDNIEIKNNVQWIREVLEQRKVILP